MLLPHQAVDQIIKKSFGPEEKRPHVLNFWREGNHVFRTDGKIIFRIKPGDFKIYKDSNDYPTTEDGFFKWDLIGTGEALYLTSFNFPKCEYCDINAPLRQACQECGDEGTVYFPNSHSNYFFNCKSCRRRAYRPYNQFECPECYGTKVVEDYASFLIGGRKFNGMRIAMLIQYFRGSLAFWYKTVELGGDMIGFSFCGGDGFLMRMREEIG